MHICIVSKLEQCVSSKVVSLQILHMKHTVCSQLVKKDIYFHDSAYTHIAANTLQVIAQLVKSSKLSIDIKLMNVSK